MVWDSIRAVEEGRDPIGVVREAAANELIRFDATKNFADGTTRPPEMLSA
jgi:hypothetical protein